MYICIYQNGKKHTNPLNPKTMNKTFQISQEVVRSKGDYVVGRTGLVVDIDSEKSRAQVEWYCDPKTWVSFTALEPTSVPYEIVDGAYNKRTGRHSYPKYRKL